MQLWEMCLLHRPCEQAFDVVQLPSIRCWQDRVSKHAAMGVGAGFKRSKPRKQRPKKAFQPSSAAAADGQAGATEWPDPAEQDQAFSSSQPQQPGDSDSSVMRQARPLQQQKRPAAERRPQGRKRPAPEDEDTDDDFQQPPGPSQPPRNAGHTVRVQREGGEAMLAFVACWD
jgi:hypothetical protein